MRSHRIRPFISIEQSNNAYDPSELDEKGNIKHGYEAGNPPWVSWFLCFDSPDEITESGDFVYHLEPDERALRGLEKAQSVVLGGDDVPCRPTGRFKTWVVEIREGPLLRKDVTVPEVTTLPDLPPEPPAWEDGLAEGFLCGYVVNQNGTPALLREYEVDAKRMRLQTSCTQLVSDLLSRAGNRVVVEGTIVGKTIYVKSWQ